MWTFLRPLSLIRYLIVLKVNRPFVRLPRCLAAQLSLILGTTIAKRLPTRDAQAWHKALRPWEEHGGVSIVGKKYKAVPEAAWPIEASLAVYPGKTNYREGELVFWELKLLRDGADHELFLEIILPALEEAGYDAATPWHGSANLWGRYNIHAIYAAHGPRWEPVVSDGRLDLRYRPTVDQWADGLTFEGLADQPFDRLTWITPFDLTSGGRPTDRQPPTLSEILESSLVRMSRLLPGKHNPPDAIWQTLSAEDKTALTGALEQASQSRIARAALAPAPKEWPGRWIGAQAFSTIPPATLPYLQLASIFHVGRQTHFGCGTFRIG